MIYDAISQFCRSRFLPPENTVLAGQIGALSSQQIPLAAFDSYNSNS